MCVFARLNILADPALYKLLATARVTGIDPVETEIPRLLAPT
jgi:hypothetical protein